MTPQINISQPLYAKLKEMAEPFVDTPETVISKAVEFYLSSHGTIPTANNSVPPSNSGHMVFQPDAPPDLTFTRPVSIELDGTKFDKSMLYWNPLLFEIVRIAGTQLQNSDQLKQMLLCNYSDGDSGNENGYRFIPEAKLSIQGQAANPAWKTIMHLVKNLGLNLEVTFVWEDKPKAAYPSKTGKMTFVGT